MKEFYWSIDSILCQPGPSGHCFSIHTSPEFEKRSQQVLRTYGQDKIREQAIEVVKHAGARPPGELLIFDKVKGLIQINISSPQTGCWLAVDGGDVESGRHWSGHNIDTPAEQVLLLALWHWWAESVVALTS